jgi:hypothetical protein
MIPSCGLIQASNYDKPLDGIAPFHWKGRYSVLSLSHTHRNAIFFRFVCFFFQILEGHKVRDAFTSPLPYTYIKTEDLPASFNWGDIDGVSYLTHSLNQHIPQYCGSCWAHGALSALSDRIKIAREGLGDEINLSIQYILNCAGDVAGSCHGGSHTGVYEFAQKSGFIPYDS